MTQTSNRSTSPDAKVRREFFTDELTANLPKRIRDRVAAGTLAEVRAEIEAASALAARNWITANSASGAPRTQPVYVDRAIAGTFVAMVLDRTTETGQARVTPAGTTTRTPRAASGNGRARSIPVDLTQLAIAANLAIADYLSAGPDQAHVKALAAALGKATFVTKPPSEDAIAARAEIAALVKAKVPDAILAPIRARYAAAIPDFFPAPAPEWTLSRPMPAPAATETVDPDADAKADELKEDAA